MAAEHQVTPTDVHTNTLEDTMGNENMTLVRGAKPKKDMPVSKDIKAGKKIVKGGRKAN